MSKRDTVIEIVLLILMLVLVLLTMLYNSNALGTQINETPIITYYKTLGGEEWRVQEVYLSCTTGASKGAMGGKEWCQEIVIREWTE